MVNIPEKYMRLVSPFDVTAARECPACNHSPDLWELVESFIDSEGKVSPEEVVEEEERDSSDVDEDDFEDVKESLREIVEFHGGSGCSGDGERRRIMEEVEAYCGLIGEKQDCSFKRQLMIFLRHKGFAAGLCKSKWERFGKNTAGRYEYVDVKIGENNRLIVETNLAGEFEIARPTTRYLSLLSQLPRVFVGTPNELKQLVRIMCFEIRRSMKRVKIHVPPWRRNGYMQAKWFGHYKRTSNEVVSRVKECDCGSKRFGFEETVKAVKMGKTVAFSGCREEEIRNGMRVGRLTMAFNGGGVGL